MARMARNRSVWIQTSLWLLAASWLLSFPGCKTVEFYEKEHVNDPAMIFSDSPAETHFLQKTMYSREGSVGGIGTGAGGGCGCY